MNFERRDIHVAKQSDERPNLLKNLAKSKLIHPFFQRFSRDPAFRLHLVKMMILHMDKVSTVFGGESRLTHSVPQSYSDLTFRIELTVRHTLLATIARLVCPRRRLYGSNCSGCTVPSFLITSTPPRYKVFRIETTVSKF